MDSAKSLVEVIPYRENYREDFARLNLEWIKELFSVEAADEEIFADPVGKVIVPGGQIFFVLEDHQAQGTCAVLRHESAKYELAKMAVAPVARGRGFGDLLVRAAIEFACAAGAQELFLSSNTKLEAALHLYEKHGFVAEPFVSDNRYARVDIMMRLALKPV